MRAGPFGADDDSFDHGQRNQEDDFDPLLRLDVARRERVGLAESLEDHEGSTPVALSHIARVPP